MTQPNSDFWSRRKAMVAKEATEEVPAELPDAAPQEELTDAEILAKFDLPDPDTLTLGDDIRGFMSKAVPEHLRRRALRKLWRTNPVLACVDGLNDYDDDFAKVSGETVKTAYQVGKGMLYHIQEMARQADVLLASKDEAVVELPQGETSDEMQELETAAFVATSTDAKDERAHEQVAPRRMRLQFDEDVAPGPSA